MGLACLVGMLVQSFAADTIQASSSPEAATRHPHILVLGDSLAAGFGVDPAVAWPALLEKKLRQDGHAHELTNAGLSGDTTAGGVRRLNWLMRKQVDILILELGGNDGLRGLPPGETRKNLKQIIRTTREKWPEVQILLAGMQMPDSMGQEFSREFASVFPQIAEEEQVRLIPHFLEKVAGDPELNLPDLIHPNPEGHRILADRVWEVLKEVLNETKKAPEER